MESLLPYIPAVVNSLTAIVAICFFGGGIFHASRQNKEDIAELKAEQKELKAEQQRMNIGFQDLRVDMTKMGGRLDLEISKIAGKIDMLIDREPKR